jgi:hypothetical protein
VKQSESLDELTLTFPEGVVATFQLLPGYPEVRPTDETRMRFFFVGVSSFIQAWEYPR